MLVLPALESRTCAQYTQPYTHIALNSFPLFKNGKKKIKMKEKKIQQLYSSIKSAPVAFCLPKIRFGRELTIKEKRKVIRHFQKELISI